MYVTIDIGGTKVKLSFFENESTTSHLKSVDLPMDSMLNYNKAISEITENILKLAENQFIDAMGIAIRGDIDPIRGKIIDTTYMPDWNDRNIVNDLKTRINCPIKIDNDAVCAAISEISLLTTKKYRNFTFIAIGTGIGGTKLTSLSNSILINPWDFGHVIIEKDGLECKCGQKGCLEAYASGWGIEKRYGTKLENLTDNKAWQDIVEYVSQAIVSYLSVNPTESFIFGGGIIFKKPGLIDEIEKTVIKNSTYSMPMPTFELSRYLDSSQGFGALSLAASKANFINMNWL